MEIVRRLLAQPALLQNTAISHAGRSCNYEALLRASSQLSQVITSQQHLSDESRSGGMPRVGLYAAPGLEYVMGTLAIWQSRGIVVPLATSFPPSELTYLFQDAGISLALATPEAADKVGSVAQANGSAMHVLSPPALQGHAQPAVGQQGAAAAQEPSMGASGLSTLVAQHASEQGALIIYTSGTTGKPKGVLHTHRSLAAQMDSLCSAWQWGPQDTILHPLPLHHIHGIVNALYCPLLVGAHVEFMTKFSATAVWDRLMEGGITVLMGVPTMYAKLLAAFDSMPAAQQARAAAAAAALRLTVSGSSACPVPIMQRWKELTGQYLLERYGMTELGMALSNPYHGHRQPGSVGVPLPHVDVRIAADSELRVRGPTLFSCYWNRPEATAQAFDEHGYFCTGDTAACHPVQPLEGDSTDVSHRQGGQTRSSTSAAASMHSTGSDGTEGDGGQQQQAEQPSADGCEQGRGALHYYSILGRMSVDIIKSSGYKVSALQVEGVLLEHPWVAETAVLGVPDAVYGETITALVFPDGPSTAQASPSSIQQALHQHCLSRLAPYQAPRRFVVLSEPLPRNAMGKINKKDLLQMLRDQQ